MIGEKIKQVTFSAMKNYYRLFLLLFSCAFVACDDDDDVFNPNLLTDTVSPIIELSSPAANDSVLLIGGVSVLAYVKDERVLDNVRVIVNDPSGGSQVIANHTAALSIDPRVFSLSEYYRIPKNPVPGEYTVVVEAKDKGQNVTKNAVTFTLHDSDIHSEEFIEAFWYILYDILPGFIDNAWDLGYAFNDDWLNNLLFLMVSTNNDSGISEAEWGKFMADFDVKNQAWPTWDLNSDGKLDKQEFYDGITRLNLFNDWDTNQDEIISVEELATAIFTLWDHNRDNVLSREEYLEKSYTYLYSERE
jgi:hypothetical protein